MTVYHVCDTCACAIVNDDHASYDLDVERVTEFTERVGYLADAGTVK